MTPAPTGMAGVRRMAGAVATLVWPGLADLGVDVVVTERGGGVSTGPYSSLNLGLHVGDDQERVVENRRRAAATVGATLDDLVFCTQPHGRGVAEVTAADRGRGALSADDAIAGADALVTTEPGPVLAIMVADCVPIVLVDPRARVLACVHAGWRGTVAGAVTAALDVMVAAGARRPDTVAVLGPAIPPDRYQVGMVVAGAVRARFGGSADRVLAPDDGEHWRLDLWTANELLLRAAGVGPGRIERSGALPTGTGRFFSHRAEQPCGRIAMLARLHP